MAKNYCVHSHNEKLWLLVKQGTVLVASISLKEAVKTTRKEENATNF